MHRTLYLQFNRLRAPYAYFPAQNRSTKRKNKFFARHTHTRRLRLPCTTRPWTCHSLCFVACAPIKYGFVYFNQHPAWEFSCSDRFRCFCSVFSIHSILCVRPSMRSTFEPVIFMRQCTQRKLEMHRTQHREIWILQSAATIYPNCGNDMR